MSQSFVAGLAWVAGIVAVLVDGPRSVAAAAVVTGAALAPAAGGVGGLPAALAVGLGGVAVALAAVAGRRLGRRLGRRARLDPDVPVTAPPGGLFGPRSIRLMGAALALPAASWVGLNVPVGGAAVAGGFIFAAADLWLVGAVRLLRARTMDDLAVGAVVVALAAATAWVLQAGPGAASTATVAVGLGVLVAGTTGLAIGRRAPRPG